jgi:CysZ protein
MIDAASFFRTVLQAARDLLRPAILFEALWPPLVAFLIWSAIAWFAWQPLAEWLIAELPDWPWLAWLGPWLSHAAVFMIFAPLVYLTALLLTGVIALPRMMTFIAARDFPDLKRRGDPRAAFWGSLANTLFAGLVFALGWLITLPLLLIPGMLLILPLFWSAWLNQRAFRFDALAEHALAEERAAIVRSERPSLYLAGLLGALAAHVPFINLFALAFTALLFVRLCLSALRRLRQMG